MKNSQTLIYGERTEMPTIFECFGTFDVEDEDCRTCEDSIRVKCEEVTKLKNEAISDFSEGKLQQWFSKVGDDPLLIKGVGNGLLFDGEYDVAKEIFEYYVGKHPKDADTHYELGQVYEHKNLIKEALREFRMHLKFTEPWRDRVQKEVELKEILRNLKDFSKDDLEKILLIISGMNGTINRANIKRILENFELVKKGIRVLWEQDDLTEDIITRTFEDLKGTAAVPALLSNILFLRNREKYNICVPATMTGLENLGRFTYDNGISIGKNYINFNSSANRFREEENLHPETVDWVLWKAYVLDKTSKITPKIWDETTPKLVVKEPGLEVLHLVYKISWHPGGYKGGFCGNAQSTACEAFNYVRKHKEEELCSPTVFHCVDEDKAFADSGWRVKIHPPRIQKLHELAAGNSLVFLAAPLTTSKTRYRLVGFYTIDQKIIENGKVVGFSAEKRRSSKFDLEEQKLVYSNTDLKNLFGVQNWTARRNYDFISSENALNVFEEIYEIHKDKKIVDRDIDLTAIKNVMESLRSGARAREISIQAMMTELIEKEPEYSEVIKAAIAHLVAGKNLVFCGPPATSKTYLARKICEHACEEGDFCFHTANAEWSYFDIVGGLILKGDRTEFNEGLLLEATERCKQSVDTGRRPCWLIIDELNRANLDLAFGKIFTQLDLDYRDEALKTIKRDGEPYDYLMPLSFRILATMNTYDRALLFSLGYAFMRRFAFIPLESLLKQREPVTAETEMQVTEDMRAVLGNETIRRLKELTKQVVFNHFSKTSGTDRAYIYSELEMKSEEDIDTALADLKIEDLDILDILLYISKKITSEGLVEVGHAIVFDAAKFIVAYSLLFPNEKDPKSLLDETVVSYLLPQLEYFMPKLRKGRIFEEKKYRDSWERLTQTMKNLNLPRTTRKLMEAEEDFRVIR